MKYKILKKVNEGQEADVPLYNWATIPESLKVFWTEYYKVN